MEIDSNKNLQQYKTKEIEQVMRELQKELDRRENVDYTGKYVYDVRESKNDDGMEQTSRITIDLMLCVVNDENDSDVLCNTISVESETNENTGETTIKADIYNGHYINRSDFATFQQLDGDIYNQLLTLIRTQNVKIHEAYKKYQEQYRVLRNSYGNQASKIISNKLGIDI